MDRVEKNPGQSQALWFSTIAFTVCFAVWTIFSIIGIQIKNELGLNETQFGLLVGTPKLTEINKSFSPRAHIHRVFTVFGARRA